MNCEICDFRNPKATVTAIIIKDNSILLLKRNHEPNKGGWDLPGGYMEEKENHLQALGRELKEELGIEYKSAFFIDALIGENSFKGKRFPVISFVFLVDIGKEDIKLSQENSEYRFFKLKNFDPNILPINDVKDAVIMAKNKFTLDLERVKELVGQLDSSAQIKEQSIYQAILNGYLAKRYDNDNLIGMGWVFPRRTLLRKQAVIEDMIVDQDHRGKGLGREMMDDLVSWAKEQGIEVIELTSNPKREAANGLYQNYGFKLHPTNHYLYNNKET
jgi:ADP-ribose pyrophosphatase YjhB (NUDIX family)/predicted GNAT family N-acyltransferase